MSETIKLKKLLDTEEYLKYMNSTTRLKELERIHGKNSKNAKVFIPPVINEEINDRDINLYLNIENGASLILATSTDGKVLVARRIGTQRRTHLILDYRKGKLECSSENCKEIADPKVVRVYGKDICSDYVKKQLRKHCYNCIECKRDYKSECRYENIKRKREQTQK
mmetsp:Transcript_24786/g.38364  ORF Transcript_24786/g.38364 Transcript_24786/m.38364 type:complete len:167 (+) Transcript_24786:84-584(+)